MFFFVCGRKQGEIQSLGPMSALRVWFAFGASEARGAGAIFADSLLKHL